MHTCTLFRSGFKSHQGHRPNEWPLASLSLSLSRSAANSPDAKHITGSCPGWLYGGENLRRAGVRGQRKGRLFAVLCHTSQNMSSAKRWKPKHIYSEVNLVMFQPGRCAWDSYCSPGKYAFTPRKMWTLSSALLGTQQRARIGPVQTSL